MLEVGCWGGSLRDLSMNIIKQGVGKGKSYSWGGGGFEGVTTPAPQKSLIAHQVGSTNEISPRGMLLHGKTGYHGNNSETWLP